MKNYHKSKLYSVAKDIWSILFTIALFVYLFIGFVYDTWHPTWFLFIVIALLSIIIYFVSFTLFKKKCNNQEIKVPFDKTFETAIVYSKCVKISGWLFIVSVITYLVSASISGFWHPLWLIFLVMAIIEQTVAMFVKIRFKEASILEVV